MSKTEPDERLLPDRYPQQELFICDPGDVNLKSDMASMEHPIFSMSKKPDRNIRRYTNGEATLEVEPGPHGIATVYDKDILIFAISQLMAAKNRGEPISRHVSFNATDFLHFANRVTNGNAYENLRNSLSRLDGTRLRTNIKTNGEQQWQAFGLIEGATIRRSEASGRVVEWGITLPEWLFNAVQGNEVLSLHRDYFRLGRPLDRRVYELCRKHCGKQPRWEITLEKLHKKCGSTGSVRQFRYRIKDLVESMSVARDGLLDYLIGYDVERDIFVAERKRSPETEPKSGFKLRSSTYENAREAAPGWDVYMLEQEWRSWMYDGGLDAPRSPDKAFLGFCRKWFEKRGRP